jgi:predicted alpha/beta hydrolase family esterase
LNFFIVPQIWPGNIISPNFYLDYRMLSNLFFILPGLYNSGDSHWQTRWERRYGYTRIHQRDWDAPDKDDWIHTINEVTAPFPDENVILIAHSLGCCTIAHWYERYGRRIKGAFMVAPSDVEAPSYPPGTYGFTPMPLPRLPFPSMVVASSDDYYVSPARAALFAERWGSSLVEIGNKGHINGESGLGDWPEGYALLQKLAL